MTAKRSAAIVPFGIIVGVFLGSVGVFLASTWSFGDRIDPGRIIVVRQAHANVTAERVAALWAHLRSHVFPHRQRLGSVVEFKVLGGSLPEAEKLNLQKDFVDKALPPSFSLSVSSVLGSFFGVSSFETEPATRVSFFLACGQVAHISQLRIKHELAAGSILLLPICSADEFDEAYRMIYNVNCDQAAMWGNGICKHGEFVHGVQLTCKDFPLENLQRVGFLPGFFVLELMDKKAVRQRLAGGDFLNLAHSIQPVTTDKVTAHHYQELYERYLPAIRASNRTMLEIGLGCNMDYGPGKSAVLWRKYFPHLHIEMMEVDVRCANKWAASLEALKVSVHVGDQLQLSKKIAEQKGKPVYDLIVDDGAHSNLAIRTSFRYLWPTVNDGGYYVIEDMGSPAFTFLDCEPLPDTSYKQTTTAVAKIVELARPLVLASGEDTHGIAHIECLLEICVVQKV